MSGTPRDQARSAVLPAVLAATALVVVLATWAASIGPGEVFREDARSSGEVTAVEDDSVVPPDPNVGRDDRDREDDDRGWGSTALFALELALLVAFLYVLFAAVRWVRLDIKDERPRRRRRRRTPRFEVLPAAPSAEQAAEEIVRDAEDQLALLHSGSPRNGIVACWHRFEVQARAAGLGRLPHETPAEFTIRVLDLVDADVHAVAELAELYREARFSDHPIQEPARAAAVDALERIHRSLRRRPVGSPS